MSTLSLFAVFWTALCLDEHLFDFRVLLGAGGLFLRDFQYSPRDAFAYRVFDSPNPIRFSSLLYADDDCRSESANFDRCRQSIDSDRCSQKTVRFSVKFGNAPNVNVYDLRVASSKEGGRFVNLLNPRDFEFAEPALVTDQEAQLQVHVTLGFLHDVCSFGIKVAEAEPVEFESHLEVNVRFVFTCDFGRQNCFAKSSQRLGEAAGEQ